MAVNLAQIIEARRGSEEPDAVGGPRTIRRRRPRRRRGRPKTLRPIKPRPIDEIEYRAELLSLVARIQAQVENVLIPLLTELEPEFLRDSGGADEKKRPGYDGEPDPESGNHLAPAFSPPRQGWVFVRDHPALITDDFSEDLDRAFKGLRQQNEDLEEFAISRAEDMVFNVNRSHEIRYMRELQRKVGIDARGLIQSEGLEATLRATTRVNVNLIESIPAEYFAKIEKLVFQNTLTGRTDAAEGSLELFVMRGDVAVNGDKVGPSG